MDFSKIEEEVRAYLLARKRFLDFAQKIENEPFLRGNDQIVGSRIGELIAYRILEERGLNPQKSISKSEKAIDIVCDGDYKVSVKLFTGENSLKRTTKIKSGWQELIVIELDTNYFVSQIGMITNKTTFIQTIVGCPRCFTKFGLT